MKEIKKFIILGISGSPRIGATDYVVKYALDLIKNTENFKTIYFTVAKKKINYCIHCDHCVKTKEGCIQKDDMQELYPLMEKADGWIIATPVYQGSLTAQIKAVLDRCRAIVAKNPKVFENKIGAAIGVGGDRIGGQELAIQTILNFYIISEMIPVGGGSFGANLGGTVWSKDKMAEGAKEDEEGLRSVRKTVKKMINMVKKIKIVDE